MTCKRVLLGALLLAVAPCVLAASAYPCHRDKRAMGANVSCQRVLLPASLCTTCKIRATDARGHFVKCWDTYDTSSPRCMSSVREYVAANPCDSVRSSALDALAVDPTDGDALQAVDYFLYSVCEQCCDCVPMGASPDYAVHAAKHSAEKPALFNAARGNCAAHAFYDICKILPNVTHFDVIGARDDGVAHAPACTLLTQWFNSPAASGWADASSSNIVPDLRAFLTGMLNAAQCGARSIWEACYEVEKKQNRLGGDNLVPTQTDVPFVSTEPTAWPDTFTQYTVPAQPVVLAVPSPPPIAPVKSDAVDILPATVEPDANDPAPAPAGPEPEWAATAKDSGADKPATLGGSDSTAQDSDAPRTVTIDSGGSQDAVGSVSASPVALKPEIDAVLGKGANDGSACFPSSGSVQLQDGEHIRMDMLRIGDIVRSGVDSYSPVILFTHRDTTVRSIHVHVTLANGMRLALSPAHYIRVNGVSSAARDIRNDDIVATTSGESVVVEVTERYADGLFNPQTAAGSIMVNGVLCSTYTETVPAFAAHALLAPIRALFRAGAVEERYAGMFLSHGASSMPGFGR